MAVIFSSITSDIIALLAIFIASLYVYFHYSYGYWERRGVNYVKPKIPFGNFTDFLVQRLSLGELVQNLYNSSNEPFVGIFSALRPTLLVRNPALLQRIFIKDFSHFSDRGK